MNERLFLELCTEKGYDEKTKFLFTQALAISKEIFATKPRLAGDSYFDHNLRVAAILAENRSPQEAVIAGILQGILKHISDGNIQEHFGAEIVAILKGAQEIKQLKERNQKLDAEAVRKILLTTLRDVRVIMVKLACKLDNLTTIHVLPPADQARIAQEVLEVYAPLAYRLGMDKIKNKLEDLSFQVLEPKKYQDIANYLQESSEQKEKGIQEAIQIIQKIAEKEKISIIKIKGRSKHIYSIYKKIVERKIKLEDQHDLQGIRVIVPEVRDCYTLLGLLHEKLEPLESRLKDYITNPKPNLYQSIHTGIKFPNGQIIEIQIRTKEMDEFAEEGIAAHWRYKGIKSEELFEKKVAWLRNILDSQKDMEEKDFVETAKVDIFGDEIYCYTPKGDAKQLPKGATVLDFAYTVHEEIGNHTVGARVNGKFVALKHELILGDVVEIVTNKSQRPRRSWIKLVKSAKAKQKIRKSLKEYEKLPSLIYRSFKPAVTTEQGLLVDAPEYPNALCVLAKCCHALPGEEIVGIATKRRIISVHKKDCRAALKEEPRWLQVQWRSTFNQNLRFAIGAEERSGVLADLLHTIANAGFEIKEAKAKLIDAGHIECSFLVVPRDLEQLKEMIKRLRKVRGILKIYFE